MELIRTLSDLQGRTSASFPEREDPQDVLLCEPKYFDVIDVKNAHMEGQVGRIDKNLARIQWSTFREAIEGVGHRVRLLDPVEGLEDMVFTANPVLPGTNRKGERLVLLSNMKHESRRKEVPAHRKWFEEAGYRILELSSGNLLFEGQGDALWHPNRRLLWGGYGFRSTPEVYEEVSNHFDAPVVLLELREDHFYHLDTCLCPLDHETALYYPGAFSSEGRALVEKLFVDLIEVPVEEAKEGFACNAMVLGRNVLIQKGNTATRTALEERRFNIIELDTSEFMKSGGSAFCMKMMVYS